MKNLKDIINLEKDKTSFVCGLGPSLSDTIGHIIKERKNIVLVSCNDIDLIRDIM